MGRTAGAVRMLQMRALCGRSELPGRDGPPLAVLVVTGEGEAEVVAGSWDVRRRPRPAGGDGVDRRPPSLGPGGRTGTRGVPVPAGAVLSVAREGDGVAAFAVDVRQTSPGYGRRDRAGRGVHVAQTCFGG